MKKVAFTIAFGKEKYQRMARCLKATVEEYSPGVEFRIYGQDDFTPLSEGLPKDRDLYPKDYKYPKVEIMSRLTEPDTKYMFIDADAFVFGDIGPYFDLLEENQVIIEYVYRGDSGWAGESKLQFHKVCADVGLENIEPYSINSGFIMWHGAQEGFAKALQFIKEFTFDDVKGRVGDEYYFCAGLQAARANIKPLDYDVIKIGKFWRGRVGFDGERLTSTRYPANDRIIQHYGNRNYYNPHVQKIMHRYGEGEHSWPEWYAYHRYELKKSVRALAIKLGLKKL